MWICFPRKKNGWLACCRKWRIWLNLVESALQHGFSLRLLIERPEAGFGEEDARFHPALNFTLALLV